jgi:hypothetical protein
MNPGGNHALGKGHGVAAFTLLKSKSEWDEGRVPSSLEAAQQDIQ